jgi:hypothetical protein
MTEQTPEIVGQLKIVLAEQSEANKYTLKEVLLVGVAVGCGYYFAKRTYRGFRRAIARYKHNHKV